MAGFAQAVALVFRAEGGLADNPADRGGRTNMGITTEIWRLWLESRGQSYRSVDSITTGEARSIYHEWFWLRGKCDGLPWPLSLVHFDGCVNHGTLSEAKLLQEALGVAQDGIIGPITLGAGGTGDPKRHAEDLIWARLTKYRRILHADESQRVFAAGWIKRMEDLRGVVVGSRPIPEATS